jgi:hypothetical protein
MKQGRNNYWKEQIRFYNHEKIIYCSHISHVVIISM